MIRSVYIFLLLFATLNASCVSLVYHHFSADTPSATSVTPALFEEHLRYLKESNFSVITATKALDLMDNLPNKCVVLTADDAYLSVYTEAFPLLKKYNFPMTVFVTTEGVERKFGAYMSYEMMGELKRSGLFEFGNHSFAHKILLKEDEFRSDLIRSKDLIERHLGTDNNIFAYPYGVFNDEMVEVLQSEGYRAFAQHSGAFNASTNLQTLTRFAMASSFAEISLFKIKVNSKPFEIVSANPPKGFLDSSDLMLEIVVKNSGFNSKNFACFYGGKQLAHEIYIEKENVKYIVKSVEITQKSSVINCTAPRDKGGYFWYSHAVFK